MRPVYPIALGLIMAVASSQPALAIQEMRLRVPVQEDVWQPAATPRGGVSWAVLEGTREITRQDRDGYIISRPEFTDRIRALNGRRIKVAGWMDVFEPGRQQTHFILLGYPPGCPFHWHAKPTQFIEIVAATPFPVDQNRAITITGVLELTGEDESGIFYRLKDARPG
jgi:hypothetical protein